MGNLNFLIIGFSGNGNTRMVYETFKRKMENRNHAVNIYEIDRYDTSKEELSELVSISHCFGFAYPVYGADLPPIFDKFLTDFKRGRLIFRDAFVISTVGYVNAFGPYIIKRRLSKIGLRMKWHIVVRMFDSTKHKSVGEKKMQRINRRINRETDTLIEDILDERPSLGGIGPWIIGGFFIRKFLKKPLCMHYKSYSVDKSLCTECMLCVNECPTNAINFINGQFVFNENCTTCFRCKNRCPVGAIN